MVKPNAESSITSEGGNAELVKSDTVKVRVIRRGDKKISKGVTEKNTYHDAFYAQGDEFRIDPFTAKALEDRDYVEIVK